MKVYTKQGDDGMSAVVGGKMLPKDAGVFAALGDLDEANACIGLAKSLADGAEVALLTDIQSWIITASAYVAGAKAEASDAWTQRLEAAIDELDAKVPAPKGFVLPGACPAGAQIDVARAVVRRAERSLTAWGLGTAALKRFVNRLSDYLYMLARYYDFKQMIQQAVAAAQGAVVENGAVFGLQAAKQLIAAVEAEAGRQGLPAVIAVCDASGRMVAVHVMDGAYLVSYDAAIKKAYTAAAVKMKTETLSGLAQPGGMFYGLASANDMIMTIGGGVPLYDRNVLVGALGVSGGTAAQDIWLAEFGLRAFMGGDTVGV